MFYDPDSAKAYKCNLCGGAPACADACPTQAITYEEAETADWIGDFAAERTAYVLKMETPDVFAAAARGSRVMPARHLIVGGGTAGLNCIRTIREEEGGQAASEITLVAAERPYSRMVLPYYLGQTIAESHVYTATPASLAAWNVKPMLGRRAERLDVASRTLTLDDGATVEFDDCLIATGLARGQAADPRRRRARRALLLDARARRAR